MTGYSILGEAFGARADERTQRETEAQPPNRTGLRVSA